MNEKQPPTAVCYYTFSSTDPVLESLLSSYFKRFVLVEN